jgi:outer membrane protein TolC
MRRINSFILSLAVAGGALSSSTSAVENINLDQFLSQVKNEHTGLKGSITSKEGGLLRSEEGKLQLAPTLFADFRVVSDAKLPQFVFLGYDKIMNYNYSFGVRKQTTFGLNASIRYDMLYQTYVNPIVPPAFSTLNTAYAVASPVIELSQSLWGGGFGRSVRATQEQLEANALASSYQSSFQAKSTLVQAEQSYWRLALVRQVIDVQNEALDRAKKIYQWNDRRARLHLGEQADVLQSEASVKSRELELEISFSEERQAAREFNSMRNQDSDQVQEKTTPITPQLVDNLPLPKRALLRDDVLAAQQSTRSAVANSIISREKDLPNLEVYASLALNGQTKDQVFTSLGDSISHSFSFDRPTEIFGIRFSSPLNLSLISKSREGWKNEEAAADLNYSRKVFEQEVGWKNLGTQYQDALQQFQLSLKLETIQKSKLNSERDRLQRGRSTTYQVLLFEQDYLQAQLARVRQEAKVLTLVAQMKLYGETL